MTENRMATLVVPAFGLWHYGKLWYRMRDDPTNTVFVIDRKYTPIKSIGQGAYGPVWSSFIKETNERVAIKKISFVFENRIGSLRILKELMFLRSKKHKNIIGIKEIMMPTELSTFKDVFVVYESMDTNLHQIIQSSPKPLKDKRCKKIIFQLLRGLNHLHSADIFRLDLKPENLLINARGELKICDFGLEPSNCNNGHWYHAPELLLICDSFGSPADMWSVGCILAEILGRRPLFPETHGLNQLRLILSILGSQHEDDLKFVENAIDKEFILSLKYFIRLPFHCRFPQADLSVLDLLSKMLVFNPSKRITAKEALCHPYFSSCYDPSDIPTANIHIDIDESIEEPSKLRRLVLNEIRLYHPNAFFY